MDIKELNETLASLLKDKTEEEITAAKEYHYNNLYGIQDDTDAKEKHTTYWLDWYTHALTDHTMKQTYEDLIKRATELCTAQLGAWNTSQACEVNALFSILKDKYADNWDELVSRIFGRK